ncbi:hybrid sensor histidine kinase/response regulator [Poseidonibacter ostreae]|uniref:histidine kinase n=1 Tax=Poseidonibacter ostreae TaxID=2654171 RepID=A0A6L4WQN2_9BACT|nr:hybrid sensor histidine kinase/response regulator [Poseidonibacter ostreae]KAB7885831.1 response regulator [Poseidonibacter ostreae]KAB7886855.1 response regulator [Poseidonibacter ostreae]KAB7889940.1 response regulator [Poseidonibacter ostreae]
MMNKQKVLIVDDNTTNIKFIADTLSDIDYISIVFATSGFKAIQIVNTQDIDLILMDINMPELDGFETVKKMDTSIPIIYVTALDDKKNIIKAFENKGVDYITKPFYPQELTARVTTHLRLVKLNKDLESEVKIQTEENMQKEKVLMHKSKLASMGEMVDAIAHQWRQPISLIKLRIDLLSLNFSNGQLDEKFMDTFKEKISMNINHMMNTLDEFRTFFRPNEETEIFDVKEMIEKVLLLVKDDFINNKIKININQTRAFTLTGVENEFKHLILNLLNNAKDAFNDKEIPSKKRVVDINILSDNEYNYIEVIDTAGGVPEDIFDSIFDANISSKEKNKGSGIGLYLSSQIAEKYHGILKVENKTNGAKFTYQQKIEKK